MPEKTIVELEFDQPGDVVQLEAELSKISEIVKEHFKGSIPVADFKMFPKLVHAIFLESDSILCK